MALSVMGNVSVTSELMGSVSTQIATLESKIGSDKVAILDSAASANIDRLILKTDKKIKSLESRRDRCSQTLSTCQDPQKTAKLLSKFNRIEERLSSYKELNQRLIEMKSSTPSKPEKQ
jgi:hypothetical protein